MREIAIALGGLNELDSEELLEGLDEFSAETNP